MAMPALYVAAIGAVPACYGEGSGAAHGDVPSLRTPRTGPWDTTRTTTTRI